MTIAQILSKMIAASNGNIHDIDHLLRVWAYARTIGELEGLDAETQYLLEVAAITHDIACPLCREKYGNTNGKYQEQEGAVLVRSFLADTGMTEAQIARVAYLVGHHHTLRNIHGPDYQILIEADYIANASENGYSKQSVMHFMDTVMKTASGKHLAASVLGISACVERLLDGERAVVVPLAGAAAQKQDFHTVASCVFRSVLAVSGRRSRGYLRKCPERRRRGACRSRFS